MELSLESLRAHIRKLKRVGFRLLLISRFTFQDCPETDKVLYPTHVVDDLKRVRIFEIHRLASSGVVPWPENESRRLEFHVDQDSIVLYSCKQALIYRTRHYLSGLKVDLCPITNLPLSRNIGDQLQLFSPSNSAADLSVSQDQLRDWAAFAPIPLSISLSLRDVSDIWVESASNVVVRLKFHSGFVLDFITRDAMDLVVCLLARLRVLNIFVISRNELLYQAPIEMARELADATAVASKNPDSTVRRTLFIRLISLRHIFIHLIFLVQLVIFILLTSLHTSSRSFFEFYDVVFRAFSNYRYFLLIKLEL